MPISFSLPLSRSPQRATLAALEEAANHHPARGASHVLFYDTASGISVHEVLPSHVALSAGLVREVQFPSVGRHVGRLLAALRRLAPGEWSAGLLSADEGDAAAALTSMHSVLDVLNLLQRDTFPAQLASALLLHLPFFPFVLCLARGLLSDPNATPFLSRLAL